MHRSYWQLVRQADMKNLNLRLRIFLFFCLAGLGSLAITMIALLIGFRQLAQPDAISAFVTTGLIAALGITGLIAGIWLLFDDHVSKPVEAIAASLRVRAHVDLSKPINVTTAKYLGDLAPAASAMAAVLDEVTRSRAEQNMEYLSEVTEQRNRLVEILSDIPVATILVSAEHEIVLYDGQAAALMGRVRTARLKSLLFDYLDKTSVLAALEQIKGADASRIEIAVAALSGEVYSGYIRAFGANGGYTLMLEPLESSAARPLTYDFELLTSARAAALQDTKLRDLVYVVFDTETTGLNTVTDDVVQLGAVRVVNGKIVADEVFDTLVNPGRPIPKRSTDVHGITNAMIADAPYFNDVCTRFQSFAQGSVFVAHNAAFDLAFLKRQEVKIDCAFDQPILDTVLMSAAIFGGPAVHTLDAICDRLSITIPADQRHTAMGDALATARALIAMISICEGRGIQTLGALQAESEKHSRVLRS